MSANVFNPNAMAAAAAAALGNSASGRHHHSAIGNQSTMLFTPTPVAGTHLAMANSPTAFPFPPPSPLFLSSINLLQQSHHQSSHLQQSTHPQPLSPWITPGSIPTLTSSNSKLLSGSKEFLSDNNNNELSTPNLSPPKGKFRSTENDSGEAPPVVRSSDHKEKQSTLESSPSRNYSPSKLQTNNCRLDNLPWPSSEASESMMLSYSNVNSPCQIKSSPVGKEPVSSKLSDSSLYKSSASPFILPPYVANSSSIPSPTYPTGMRPTPPSPHTPTQHAAFGSPYSHYLIPPSLYSYYHNQHQSSHSYSPTNQSHTSSPISPFLVPNLPQSASSIISNSNSGHSSVNSLPNAATTVSESYLQDNIHKPTCNTNEKANSERDVPAESNLTQRVQVSQLIDLTPGRKSEKESPVDCSKSSPRFSPKSEETRQSNDSNAGMKRKTPVEDNVDSSKTNGVTSPPTTESSSKTSSRKHRILKPPNINITDCDYRNGYGSAFLPSPLFAQHFSSHLSSSPYNYLDHIPLSAPPVPPSHQNSVKCFDFSPAQHDTFSFASPGQLSSNSNKELPIPLNFMNHLNSSSFSSIPYGSPSLGSLNSSSKSDLSNSASGRDQKKNSSNNNGGSANSTNESKVTFQVPQPLNKNATENQENRYSNSKDKNQLSLSNNPKSKLTNGSVRKQSQHPDYFRKGSTIKLGNGGLKKVEELSTEDFIQSASANGKFKVELSEVMSIKEKNKKGTVRIGFAVGQSRVKVYLDSPLEHPFFVYQKGWSSCSPSATSKLYGLTCHRLILGDTVVTLANKPVNSSPAKTLTSQKLSRSLASSSGSLSSSSSVSSSSSSLSVSASNNSLYSQPSTVSQHVSLTKCPPPAHVSKTVTKNASNSNHDTALNLDTKSAKSCSGSGNRVSDRMFTARRGSQEEEEEIDVEKVDDEYRGR